MNDLTLLESALQRERAARSEAERLLENKTREVYLANQEILSQNEALQAHQQQLIQSEKMASIGLLSAGVAHEINNPVGYAYSNIQLLQERVPQLQSIDCEGNAPLREVLDDLPDLIHETLEGLIRVRTIVDDLRGFARQGSERFEFSDLREAIQRALNLLSNKTRYQCEVKLCLNDIPRVECNIEKIGQVMLNLIFNAAQAIRESGTIVVSTRLEDQHVVVSVQDDGEGIEQQHLGDVFSPFFTTKPAGEGTGLGLFICYRIVQEHAGDIVIESEPGRGTCVNMRLPIRQPDSSCSSKGGYPVNEYLTSPNDRKMGSGN